jgi:hypothetical protein
MENPARSSHQTRPRLLTQTVRLFEIKPELAGHYLIGGHDIRKIVLRSLRLTLLAMALVCGSAISQTLTEAVVADIPFSFTVDNATLPPGKHESQKVGPWEFEMADAKGDFKVIFLTEPTESVEQAKAPELVFNVYGDKHYLSKIWFEDEEGGYCYYLAKSRSERASFKSGTGKIHKIPATKK